MRRLLSVLALTAVLSVGLCACGSGTDYTDSASAGDESAFFADADSSENAGEWAPNGTVSIAVSSGADEGTNLTARIFAQYAEELTGVSFNVVNVKGTSGSVAADQVLEAANDGMTMLYGHSPVNAANIEGITDYNYEAFTPGPTFAKDPAQGFYVASDKYADLNALIEAAEAAPGTLKAATEVGAYTYYEILAFEKAAGIEFELVDAGSDSEKITAMLSGQIDLMPCEYLKCKEYIEAGRLTCVGAPIAEDHEIFEGNVPSFTSQGIDFVYPDCDYSLYFPADTADNIIAYYDDLVKQVLENEDAVEALKNLPVEPCYLTSAESAGNEASMYAKIRSIADDAA